MIGNYQIIRCLKMYNEKIIQEMKKETNNSILEESSQIYDINSIRNPC